MKPWLTTLIIIILIIAIVGGAAYLGTRTGQVAADHTPQAPVTVPVSRGDVQETVTAPSQLVGRQELLLGFEVSGQLTEIAVRPGDRVQAGTILARLNPGPLEDALADAQLALTQAEAQHTRDLAEARLDLKIATAELEQEKAGTPAVTAAEAALAAARAELEELQAGPDDNETTVAAAELRQAEIALKQAQGAYDKIAYSADIGTRPEAVQLEKATLTYEAKLAAYNLAIQAPAAATIAQAQAKVQQAQADYDRALAEQGVKGQKIIIMEAQVEKARLALAALEAGVDPTLARRVETAAENLRDANLTAPFEGTILEVLAKPGETVLDGAGVILMADTSAVEVWTKVIEEDLPLVQIGQPVEVFFDAVPDVVAQGRVSRIVPQRLEGEDRPLYPVYIALDETPENIVPGMTADASIIIAQQTGVLRLPRALVQARSNGSAVLDVWANNQIQRHEVRVGLRGDVYVEIVAGLAEGDQVVGQ